MKRRTKKPRSLWELFDWHCPRFIEIKPGSTEYGATTLEISGLLNGCYHWRIIFRRYLFADGSPADWQIGKPSTSEPDGTYCKPETQVCRTFSEALSRARLALNETPLPHWADQAA
jgi:hypothetical protein